MLGRCVCSSAARSFTGVARTLCASTLCGPSQGAGQGHSNSSSTRAFGSSWAATASGTFWKGSDATSSIATSTSSGQRRRAASSWAAGWGLAAAAERWPAAAADDEDDDILDEDMDSGDEAGPVARTEFVRDQYVEAFIRQLDLPRKEKVRTKAQEEERYKKCQEWDSCKRYFPDPAKLAAPTETPAAALSKAAWVRQGTYIYICAWDITHPVIMRRHFRDLQQKPTAVPPCPRCHRVDKVTPEEWSKKPRRVFDFCDTHLLYSMRYRCTDCPQARPGGAGRSGGITSFSAHDKGVITQLPAVLANSFPFIVTHRAAVTKEAMQFLSTMMISPASFNHWANSMREAHAENVLVKNEAMADLAKLLQHNSDMTDYTKVKPPLLLEPLDVDVKTPRPNYLTNVYLWGPAASQRRDHYKTATRLTHSPIWRFDHCHKPSKLVRLKDGSKASEGAGVLVGSHMQIMGLWNVASTSMDEVKAPLIKAAERSAALGSPVVVFYVDNAQVVAHKWQDILPGVVVKQDPWHLQQRILRAVGDPKHLAYESFRGAISGAVFELVKEDRQAVENILNSPISTTADKMLAWRSCRKHIPDGGTVYANLVKVLADYEKLAGAGFITSATWEALHNQKGLLYGNYLSDPFPVQDMYYKDTKGVLRSHRSESQAENVIGRYNRLFSGANMSGELADALATDWAGRANVDAAVTHQGLPNYNVKDLVRLSAVNDNFKQLGAPLPYPGVHVGRLAPVEEQFGFANTPYAAAGGSSLAAAAAVAGPHMEQLQVDDGLQLTEACFVEYVAPEPGKTSSQLTAPI